MTVGEFLLIENPSKEVGEMQDVSGRVAMQWKPTDLSLPADRGRQRRRNGLRPYDTLIDEIGAACRANPPEPPQACDNGAPLQRRLSEFRPGDDPV